MAGPANNTTPKGPEVKVKAEAPKLFPVRLDKNYRPNIGVPFKIRVNEGEEGEPEWAEKDPEGKQEVLNSDGEVSSVAVGDYKKVFAGTVIMVPAKDAKHMIKNKIAVGFSELED